jgi:hypothetical protein
MVELVLELLSIPLLLATAFWSVRVHRRLVALRVGRDEIAEFVETLATATARAERSVQEMKTATGEAAAAQEAQAAALDARRQELQRTIDAAQKMVRRLEDVLGQGARLAAELRAHRDAATARAARPEPPPATAVAPAEAAAAPAAPRRRAADDLLEALQKLR